VRASYGLMCRELYNPKIHFGATPEPDRFKKHQRWVAGQIDWLIKKVRP
jgi:hypothetical protein